jgi:hypothetical protein
MAHVRRRGCATIAARGFRAWDQSPSPRSEPGRDLIHIDPNQTLVICLRTELRQTARRLYDGT